ncbi:hypothetical protein MRX96_046596 [Rhipicephalus microplus]
MYKEFVEQSLKQQNFTSLYHLLPHHLSRKWLRYIKYHLTTAVLAQLPRFVCEALCCFRQLDELSLVAVLNGDDRSVMEVLDQQAHLRRVMQRPLNLTVHAQHLLSHKWLRYIEYRLTTAILSQLPRFVCEALCCFRQLDELSLVTVLNGATGARWRYSTSRPIYKGSCNVHSTSQPTFR